MASEEHKKLSNFIKNTHINLRESATVIGPDLAWTQHLQNQVNLSMYAKSMQELATNHWVENSYESRIEWIVRYCDDYFGINFNLIQKCREKEIQIYAKITTHSEKVEWNDRILNFNIEKLNLLDVGSCYNPFKKWPQFNTTAIDIAPANDNVYKCDFLNVKLDNIPTIQISKSRKEIKIFPKNFYDVAVFSLVLEYIPSSKQRILMCQKAYDVLKYEGILIIITPDSRHPGANAKLIKNWRYTLSKMGFSRIKYEKLTHIYCLVFRKTIYKEVSIRWANLYKEDYMTNEINIPQDFNETKELLNLNTNTNEIEGSNIKMLFNVLPDVL